MNRAKTILLLTIAVLTIFIGVFLYGKNLGKNEALQKITPIVTSQTILDRITDQYFLVTKTIFSSTHAEIETPKSNNWTDLFTGKKITVQGLIRTDIGVNIKNLNVQNIVLDSQNKTVTINLPNAEILDSSLSGKIDVVVDKSIVEKLKSLLNNTQNEDYNLALQTLISTAKTEVVAQENIFTDARSDSAKLVALIVKSMLSEHQVIIK
jgi:hypothetical protein